MKILENEELCNNLSVEKMNILIDGTNTENKGAELMLYAILRELEKNYPKANVFFPAFGIKEVSYIKTMMNCSQRKVSIMTKFFRKTKISQILREIFRIPYSSDTKKYPIKGLDLVLDAAGLSISDQRYKSNGLLMILDNYYKTLKKQGSKIIFLPQAFGPFKTKNGKKQVELIKKYADCIVARDEVSHTHLVDAGIDKKKIVIYPDFTACVEGEFPSRFEHLRNRVAIIPNLRMIDKGAISKMDYYRLLVKVIAVSKKYGKNCFFLNHEGKGDFQLCQDINKELGEELPIANDLTALEVKGLISQCYFVFSSRFHGVVSALSSGVPCLATSWSHKYKMLFNDYGMEGCVYNPSDSDSFYKKLELFLDAKHNNATRSDLSVKAESIKNKNREMWQHVWKIVGEL
jgi:colanic acid/amylovoran biosynthesis protein